MVISELLEAIVYNQRRIMPVSTNLNKWNGISDVCLGVPAIVGKNGIESVWPLTLTSDEIKKLKASAKTIKKYLS